MPTDLNNEDEMLKKYEIDNIRALIELNDDELHLILKNMRVNGASGINGKDMIQYLSGLSGLTEDERTLKIIKIFAEKYCRCIGSVRADGAGNKYAICSKTIFNDRGLKGPGKNMQCTPTPLLYPYNGVILRKK